MGAGRRANVGDALPGDGPPHPVIAAALPAAPAPLGPLSPPPTPPTHPPFGAGGSGDCGGDGVVGDDGLRVRAAGGGRGQVLGAQRPRAAGRGEHHRPDQPAGRDAQRRCVRVRRRQIERREGRGAGTWLE